MADRKSLPKSLRFEILKRDSFRCQYCGNGAPEVLLQVDHIKPVADGGTDDIWNLVTACQPCNSGKSDKLLSDHAVISKAKKQLNDLQARREQLDMLMDWQRGLRNLTDDTLSSVSDYWRSATKNYSINEYGRDSLRKLLHTFSVEEIVKGINEAEAYFEIGSDGTYTSDSVETAFNAISRICAVNQRTAGNADLKELYRVRGVIRKRLCEMGKFFNGREALDILTAAAGWGVPMGSLWGASCSANNYANWVSMISELIERQKGLPE